MQTPSHFLTTAFVNHVLPAERIPKHKTGFLIGAVFPDVTFTLLTLGYEVYYQWITVPPPNPYDSVMEYLHFELFFNDPIWIIGHNTFHSLVVNLFLLLIGYVAVQYKWQWGVFLSWLAAGMFLHTVVDVFTHASDGPLLFFPLNWSYRFASPVSYWEADHFGLIFVILEYTLNALILLYFARRWWQQRQSPE